MEVTNAELEKYRKDIQEAYIKYHVLQPDEAALHERMDLILRRLTRYLLLDHVEFMDIICVYEKAEDDFWYE